jgi:C1A family cysteine protease
MGNTTSLSSFLLFSNINSITIERFIDYTQTYNKSYNSPQDYGTAFDNFNYNMEWIRKPPVIYDHKLSVNQFMDIHPTEFRHMYKGYRNPQKTRNCKTFQSGTNTSALPDSVDWRDHNAVTPVKDQGQCGSCWSFSATGAMEGAWAIQTDNLLSLSEQQLIDCSKSYGDFGCNGGEMDSAFRYAIDNGMCTEDEDPYLAKVDTCVDCDTPATFSACVDVTSNNQLHLKEAVAQGPVSVAIEADTAAFQFYSSGIINNNACGTTLDHGVLVVGYGEEDGEMYWLVKNSWSSSWGDQGYVKIARSDSENDPGVCGIAMQPSYPVV